MFCSISYTQGLAQLISNVNLHPSQYYVPEVPQQSVHVYGNIWVQKVKSRLTFYCKKLCVSFSNDLWRNKRVLNYVYYQTFQCNVYSSFFYSQQNVYLIDMKQGLGKLLCPQFVCCPSPKQSPVSMLIFHILSFFFTNSYQFQTHSKHHQLKVCQFC